MKTVAILVAALALAACSGNFGSGGGGNSIVPPAAPIQPAVAGATPANGASPAPSPTGDTATYPFSQAPAGMQCPTVGGFSCLLKFNAPAPTPTPTATPKGKHPAGKTKAKAKSTASPTPSPTPTPSPAPSTNGASPKPSPSASPSGSPSPAPNVTFQLAALPKDAPAMVNPDPKSLSSTPLLTLRMHADGNIVIDGTAIAQFTLPKEQIGGRSYAIQLYQETTKKKRVDDKYVGTFSDSTLDGNTLRFVFTPPKLEIKKDEVWLFVLYAGETPGASAIPSGSPGPSASPSVAPSPTPTPTPTPAQER